MGCGASRRVCRGWCLRWWWACSWCCLSLGGGTSCKARTGTQLIWNRWASSRAATGSCWEAFGGGTTLPNLAAGCAAPCVQLQPLFACDLPCCLPDSGAALLLPALPVATVVPCPGRVLALEKSITWTAVRGRPPVLRCDLWVCPPPRSRCLSLRIRVLSRKVLHLALVLQLARGRPSDRGPVWGMPWCMLGTSMCGCPWHRPLPTLKTHPRARLLTVCTSSCLPRPVQHRRGTE